MIQATLQRSKLTEKSIDLALGAPFQRLSALYSRIGSTAQAPQTHLQRATRYVTPYPAQLQGNPIELSYPVVTYPVTST